MSSEATWNIESFQQPYPRGNKLRVVVSAFDVVYEIVNIEFALPLALDVGTVGEAVGIAEPVPIVHMERRTFPVLQVPAVNRYIGAEFKWCRLASEMIVETVSHNLIFARFALLSVKAPASLPIPLPGR